MQNVAIIFQAEILQHEDMDAGFIAVPDEIANQLGAKHRTKVKAKFEGVEYRGSLARMKSECLLLGVRKEIRNQIGKQFGDIVNVEIELDTEPRIVEIPEDVLAVFIELPAVKEKFHKLSYTHQKEHINAINEAKKIETRTKRILKMIEFLENK